MLPSALLPYELRVTDTFLFWICLGFCSAGSLPKLGSPKFLGWFWTTQNSRKL